MAWTHIIEHHTGEEEKDAAQVKRYHLSLGWRDVGYHYIIERDGKVVKGRTGTGAHCKAGGMNSKGIGIAMIGNMNNRKPTAAQYASMIELSAKLSKEHNIPVKNILGHKEVPGASTACPGKNVNMTQVRADVQQALNPPAPKPPQTGKYKVTKTIPGYYTSGDAKGRKNKKTDIKAGDYYVYNESQGMVNVTKKAGVPGAWINPADNAPAPASGKLYRVQIGAYSVKKNAETQLAKAKKAGFADAFITEY
jgi:N-acetylmuramoyl-L-alanine amidase